MKETDEVTFCLEKSECERVYVLTISCASAISGEEYIACLENVLFDMKGLSSTDKDIKASDAH